MKEPSREKAPFTFACNDINAFFTLENPKRYHAWSCQNVCDVLTFLLDNIFIRFGTNLYRKVFGIPQGTNCASLVSDLFLFCYESKLMMSLSEDKLVDIIDAFNSTSRYLDDILNMNHVYFDNMVSQIYPQSSNLIKVISSIPKQRLETCICQFLMILFLPKLMINLKILILKLSISNF